MKYTIILLIILTGMSISSCEKWLDVQPRSQIKESELFESEAGFKEALAGVYTILTNQSLYGKELTYGMMGVLSHEWTSFPTVYQDDYTYNYTTTATESRIAAIWRQMYEALSNANNIVENIDNYAHVFSGDNHAIIKGEALALRAFIHFDLLRCFGASYADNPSLFAIPYVTTYAAGQTVQYTVDEVARKVLADLKTASTLLEVDPIYTGRTVTELDDSGYLLNRQLHLNYYAVEGLLARVYLYMEEYEDAKIHATNVINSNQFSFTTQSNFISGTDLSGAPEHLFALQVVNLTQYAQNFLSEQGTGVFSLDETTRVQYYEEVIDYRYQYLFESGTNTNADQRYLLKFNEPTSGSLSYYRNKVPIIKLSEMYYILAECNNVDNANVLPYFNAVRSARGITPFSTNPPDFRAAMTSEFIKEFIGEGQLFYYYKRINQAFTPGAEQNVVDIRGYIFPIPDAEYDAADRVNNR